MRALARVSITRPLSLWLPILPALASGAFGGFAVPKL